MKIITGEAKPKMNIPPAIRMFGWSMLCVHLQQLNWIVGKCEGEGCEPAPQLVAARDYVKRLIADGPDTVFFTQWCRDALDMSEELTEKAEQRVAEEAARTAFTLIPGGESDD